MTATYPQSIRDPTSSHPTALLIIAFQVSREVPTSLSYPERGSGTPAARLVQAHILKSGVRMKRTITLLIVCVFSSVIAASSAALACSLGFDWADPPAQEQLYDPARAPAPPNVATAEVRFYEDNGNGCTGVSSCGDYSTFTVNLNAAPDHDLIRVVHDDGSVAYARPYPHGDGLWSFSLPWPKQKGEPAGVITLAVIDAEGYPSLETEIAPLVEGGEQGGCTVSSAPASSYLLLALLVAAVLRRQRRTARSHVNPRG
jgi:MYXO-CTERM domain-containing protein